MPRTPLAALAAVALVVTLAPAAAAAPEGASPAGRDATSGGTDLREAPGRAAADASAGRTVGRGLARAYPRQTGLAEPAVNEADASIKLGLTPFHEIAPRLNALQAKSDRVSVEVIGESVRGRELYLVTVTSPETPGEAKQQDTLRRLMTDRPDQAARDRSLVQRYKAPLFINNNIHGNEWEGTDAALRLVEDLATSTDAETDALLDRTRVYTVITMNPDGRVGNTRANGNGFDMNRDFITASPAGGSRRAPGAHRHAAAGDDRPARLRQRHPHRADHAPARARTTSTTCSSSTPTRTASRWRPRSTASATPSRRTACGRSRSRSATTRRAGTTGRRSSRRSTPPSTARCRTPSSSRSGSTTRRTPTRPRRSCGDVRRSTPTSPRRRCGPRSASWTPTAPP